MLMRYGWMAALCGYIQRFSVFYKNPVAGWWRATDTWSPAHDINANFETQLLTQALVIGADTTVRPTNENTSLHIACGVPKLILILARCTSEQNRQVDSCRS